MAAIQLDTPSVIIIGGGLAGMAAAACLAEAGFAVDIVEKRRVLGGRASSFFPPGETEQIDNCQHVLLGCCTNLLDFFRRTGTLDQFRFYDSYIFLGPKGKSVLKASALPAPLHLLPSLLGFRDLDWRDKLAISRAMTTMLRMTISPHNRDEPFIEWLVRNGQTKGAIENFWRVVLTSALNEDLERLSSLHAFKVFRDGFLAHRDAYKMGVPTVPLTRLYASEVFEARCKLRLDTMASAISCSGDSLQYVELRNGEQLRADFFISTAPPDALRNLLPAEAMDLLPGTPSIDATEWSPITGIHLWFDRHIMDDEHAAIVGNTIQWVFNRSAIGGKKQEGTGDGQYLQIVVSASRSFLNMKREEILDLALRELGELFPKAREAKLMKAVVVKEAKSTLSPRPGIDLLRPGTSSRIKNLFFAGDWIATGWPFTMEGAVRSGYLAAESVAKAAGRPQSFLKPDLPVSLLARLVNSF